jgi:hypothetical protein
MARGNETTSTRLLKPFLGKAPESSHGRRSAPSYYEHAGTQVIDPASVKAGTFTKMLWSVERWLERRSKDRTEAFERKALKRLNSK